MTDQEHNAELFKRAAELAAEAELRAGGDLHLAVKDLAFKLAERERDEGRPQDG